MKRLSSCPHVITYHGSYEIQREDFIEAYILMELADRTAFDWLEEADKKGRAVKES